MMDATIEIRPILEKENMLFVQLLQVTDTQ